MTSIRITYVSVIMCASSDFMPKIKEVASIIIPTIIIIMSFSIIESSILRTHVFHVKFYLHYIRDYMNFAKL